MNALASVISDARTKKRLSQRKLAKRAGVSQSAIQNIEAGTTKEPSSRVLEAIAEELDLDAERLKVLAGIRKPDAVGESIGEDDLDHNPYITPGQAAVLDYLFKKFPPEKQMQALKVMQLAILLTPDDFDEVLEDMEQRVQEYKKAS